MLPSSRILKTHKKSSKNQTTLEFDKVKWSLHIQYITYITILYPRKNNEDFLLGSPRICELNQTTSM